VLRRPIETTRLIRTYVGGSQFVVSMAGAAYDAQVERLNRQKVRQEVFIESSCFADFGVGAGVCGSNSVSGTG
jgi:hypothetical protein